MEMHFPGIVYITMWEKGRPFEHGSDWDFSNIYETECIILASEASQKKIQ